MPLIRSLGEPLIWVGGGAVYPPEDGQSGRVQLDPELYNEERLSDNLLVATPKLFYYNISHSCDPTAIVLSHTPKATNYVEKHTEQRSWVIVLHVQTEEPGP